VNKRRVVGGSTDERTSVAERRRVYFDLTHR
jgi:hypothetical protein